MKKIRKKLYMTLAVVTLLTVIFAGVFIWKLSNQGTVSAALNFGNQYLSELDYDSAIREYSKVLMLDPLNEEALTGLAKSYVGQGNVEMANTLFTNDLVGTHDMDALREYAHLLEDMGNYAGAMQTVLQIVEYEDADEDYEWLDSLIEKFMDIRHDYAASDIASISLQNGAVYTMGSNVLGALGTQNGIGTTSVTEKMANAEFLGNAKSVHTTGAGTAVIDEKDVLWLAGSNRSAQKANDSSELLPVSGWSEVTTLSNVAKAAGIRNTTFALTKTGDLYMIGGNDGYTGGDCWKDHWTRICGYGKIVDVQCSSNFVAFLTIEGRLYMSAVGYYDDYSGTSSTGWSCVASDVIGYTVSDGDVVWYKADGCVEEYLNYLAFPEEWSVYDESGYYTGNRPDFEISGIAHIGDSLFLLGADGVLYRLNNRVLSEIPMDGIIESIYGAGDKCVVQIENGGFQLFDASGISSTL